MKYDENAFVVGCIVHRAHVVSSLDLPDCPSTVLRSPKDCWGVQLYRGNLGHDEAIWWLACWLDNVMPQRVDGHRVPTDEERRAAPPRAFECVECGTDIAEHDERGAVGCVFEASVYYPFVEPE